MATIIDYSPIASNVKQLIAANSKTAIAPPLQPVDAIAGSAGTKLAISKQFYQEAPDILFVADYFAGKKQGCLVVWEDYYHATHYELFKRNKLSVDQEWERILFLDSTTLAQETKNFKPYIENTLGLPMKQNNYYAILDTNTEIDKIYEYQLEAGYYPQSSDIDYELIFQSKNLINRISVNNTDTVFDLSTRVYGTTDFAWLISLFNRYIPYFGKTAASKSVASYLVTGNFVYLPKDITQVVKAFSESCYFFGLKSSIKNMFDRMVYQDGNPSFFTETLNALNEKSKILSYTTLNNRLQVLSPNYAKALSLIKSNLAPTATILIPQYEDTISFDSVADLTIMFERLLSIYTAYTYGTDNDFTPHTAAPVVKPLAIPTNTATGAINTKQPTTETYPFVASETATAITYKTGPSTYATYAKQSVTVPAGVAGPASATSIFKPATIKPGAIR